MGVFHRLLMHTLDASSVAVQGDGFSYTYCELKERALRASAWLQGQGISPGQLICLQLPKVPVQLELILGALALGCPVLPLNTTYTPAEIEFYLNDSGTVLSCLPQKTIDQLGECSCLMRPSEEISDSISAYEPMALPAERNVAEQAFLLYTSGTTGRPKGAMISHGNVLSTVEALNEAWRFSQKDVLLHALPLFHVHGLFVAQFLALFSGARTIWMSEFSPEVALNAMAEGEVSVFMGVPTLYSRFLSLPADLEWDLSGMRLFTSGSAPLSVQHHDAFLSRFGHQILERYGMTEVGIVLSNPYAQERRPGTVGFPLKSVCIRIVDPENGQDLEDGETGEILISGPSVIREYHQRPEQTAESLKGGWMRSGDLGCRDSDGYYRIVGRSKDLIITGGLNVYPREVEAVFLDRPDIDDIAVVGVHDEDWGERVVAAVISRSKIDVSELTKWAKSRLAPYKISKEVRIVEDFPRNAMGKVQKALIRRRWQSLI